MKITSISLTIDDWELIEAEQGGIMESLQGLIRYLKEIPAISGIELFGTAMAVTVVSKESFISNDRTVILEFREGDDVRNGKTEL